MGLKDQTQTVMNGDKYVYLLNHLAGPILVFDTGSLTGDGGLLIVLGWMTSEPQESCCLQLCAEFIITYHYTQILCRC